MTDCSSNCNSNQLLKTFSSNLQSCSFWIHVDSIGRDGIQRKRHYHNTLVLPLIFSLRLVLSLQQHAKDYNQARNWHLHPIFPPNLYSARGQFHKQSGKCSHYLGIKAQSPQCNGLQTIGNQMNKKFYISPITNSQHTVREGLAARILTRYMQDKQTQSGCTAMMLHSQ